MPTFNKSDGVCDLLAWEHLEKDKDSNNRKPVIIECDIRKLDFKLLAEIQIKRYGQLFTVILMDPPWFVGLNLKYPVLRDKDILKIPFETL